MQHVINAINWLFATREGVVVLLVGAVVLSCVIAALFEVSTRRRYIDYAPSEDDIDFDNQDSSDQDTSA